MLYRGRVIVIIGLAIQGSFRDNGITSAMLNYTVEESKKAGYDVEYIRVN